MFSSSFAIVIACAAILLWILLAYNRFISLVNGATNAWADIDVHLKRRADLIPNLVTIVKGYAKHEKGVFETVAKTRSALLETNRPGEKARANIALTGAIGSLMAIAENYPKLMASENFARLQEELTNTENTLEASRRYYNATVRELNTAIGVFPNNLAARLFGIGKREFFQVDEEAKNNITI